MLPVSAGSSTAFDVVMPGPRGGTIPIDPVSRTPVAVWFTSPVALGAGNAMLPVSERGDVADGGKR